MFTTPTATALLVWLTPSMFALFLYGIAQGLIKQYIVEVSLARRCERDQPHGVQHHRRHPIAGTVRIPQRLSGSDARVAALILKERISMLQYACIGAIIIGMVFCT
jgi:hypothetical protein